MENSRENASKKKILPARAWPRLPSPTCPERAEATLPRPATVRYTAHDAGRKGLEANNTRCCKPDTAPCAPPSPFGLNPAWRWPTPAEHGRCAGRTRFAEFIEHGEPVRRDVQSVAPRILPPVLNQVPRRGEMLRCGRKILSKSLTAGVFPREKFNHSYV
jgi:hypothetical protein